MKKWRIQNLERKYWSQFSFCFTRFEWGDLQCQSTNHFTGKGFTKSCQEDLWWFPCHRVPLSQHQGRESRDVDWGQDSSGWPQHCHWSDQPNETGHPPDSRHQPQEAVHQDQEDEVCLLHPQPVLHSRGTVGDDWWRLDAFKWCVRSEVSIATCWRAVWLSSATNNGEASNHWDSSHLPSHQQIHCWLPEPSGCLWSQQLQVIYKSQYLFDNLWQGSESLGVHHCNIPIPVCCHVWRSVWTVVLLKTAFGLSVYSCLPIVAWSQPCM